MKRLAMLTLSSLLLPTVVTAATAPPKVTVLIAYASRTGRTAAMAKAVAEGAKSVTAARVVLKTVEAVSSDDLLNADAIIVGSPVHNAGVSAEVKAFIDRWPFGKLKDKVGAAFCTAGGTSAGEELTQVSMLTSMMVYQFVLVGGETWQSPFGASAIAEEGRPADKPGVNDAALEKARALGARVARYAQLIKAGRQAVAGSALQSLAK